MRSPQVNAALIQRWGRSAIPPTDLLLVAMDVAAAQGDDSGNESCQWGTPPYGEECIMVPLQNKHFTFHDIPSPALQPPALQLQMQLDVTDKVVESEARSQVARNLLFARTLARSPDPVNVMRDPVTGTGGLASSNFSGGSPGTGTGTGTSPSTSGMLDGLRVGSGAVSVLGEAQVLGASASSATVAGALVDGPGSVERPALCAGMLDTIANHGSLAELGAHAYHATGRAGGSGSSWQ